ncbi:MAG: hypothetical protein H6636_03150 [Anaerolineales bacterium]|nr:hypothetical protein [Anaerolineales bacterium]
MEIIKINLFQIGLAFSSDGKELRALSTSRDYIPLLPIIAKQVITSRNQDDTALWSSLLPLSTSVIENRLEQFFASFPYPDAINYLSKILKTKYKKLRSISREVSEEYKVSEAKNVRDRHDDSFVRIVRYVVKRRKIQETVEYYNPMAEGAYQSLTKIAEEFPQKTNKIEKILRNHPFISREPFTLAYEEDIHTEYLDPELEEWERWEDAWD